MNRHPWHALWLAALLCACSSGGGGDAVPGGGGNAANSQCPTSAVVEGQSPPETPAFTLDPLGPWVDVTCNWQYYQPAAVFCIKPDAPHFTPEGSGELTDGSDPACQFSGFAASETGLHRVELDTPILCAGCRRMFMDFSRIPADDPDAQLFYAHGHAYYRVMSLNPGYTVEPDSHSPNTKNFYNDKLVSPPGTPIEQLVGAIDNYDMAYVTDTRLFVYNVLQGLHYTGPWYVNRDGRRIRGAYLDVNVGNATPSGEPGFDALRYMTAYNSGQPSCFDNNSEDTADGDLFYGGCIDRFGGSSMAFNPFP